LRGGSSIFEQFSVYEARLLHGVSWQTVAGLLVTIASSQGFYLQGAERTPENFQSFINVLDNIETHDPNFRAM
jgi:hypothetical protein